MTVSELIAKLQEMPQDMRVYCYGYNGEDSVEVKSILQHPVEISVKTGTSRELIAGYTLYDYKRVSVDAVVLYEE